MTDHADVPIFYLQSVFFTIAEIVKVHTFGSLIVTNKKTNIRVNYIIDPVINTKW